MSARPVDWTPLATSDPVPGDHVALRRAATHYGAVATAIENAASRLRTLTAGLNASSKAVDTLRGSAEDVAKDITKAHERYVGVATALTNYVPHLEIAQDASLRLLTLARTADAEACDARRLATAAADRAGTLPPGIDASERAEQNRQDCLAADANDRLDLARRDLADVIEARDTAQRTAVNLIKDVHGSGGLKDGWRDNLGGFVNKFVAPILPALNMVSAALGGAALVLAWVPFLGPALGAAALIVAGVTFLANLSMSVGKEAGWRDTVIAGIGLASFGLGKIASARYVTAAGGARGAARRLAGQWAAKSPAARAVKNLPTDANSAAALRTMVGQAGSLSRHQARNLLDDAAKNGLRSTSGKFFRELPGKTVQDLGEIRHLRTQHLDDLPPAPGRIFGLVGERGMGPAAANLDTIHPVIRGSAEVSKHLGSMGRASHGVFGGFVGGSSVWTYETVTLGNSSNGAERLKLSDRGVLEPSG